MTDLYCFSDPEALPEEVYQLLCRTLPPERVRRAERCRFPADRRQRLLGSALLRLGVFRRFHLDIRQCRIEADAYGKPFLAGLPAACFNISHCKSAVVCAIDGSPVGADVQDRIKNADRVAARVLSPAEMEEYRGSGEPERWFTRIWSMKESYVKYTGLGLGQDFRELDFSGTGIGCTPFRGLYITTLELDTAEQEPVFVAVCAHAPDLRFHTVSADERHRTGRKSAAKDDCSKTIPDDPLSLSGTVCAIRFAR